MIEWITGGILVAGLGYLGYTKYKKIDINKLDIADAKDLFIMISEFIAGGEDGIIEANDAILLLKRLEELIEANEKEL